MSQCVQLTSGHLLFDHGRMRDLLSLFEQAERPELRARLMRAALDLFYIHTWLEESLFELKAGSHSVQNELSELANRLERLDPMSNLHYNCGCDFARHMRRHLSEEERTLVIEPRVLSHPTSFDSEILVQRRQTLKEIRDLVAVC